MVVRAWRYDGSPSGGAVCTSYKVGDIKIFDAFSEFPAASFDFKADIYKDYAAPVFRVSAPIQRHSAWCRASAFRPA
jgi:hypothetical protein